ncbi:MAG: response regulator transcription factor [Bacteroidota bacterium]
MEERTSKPLPPVLRVAIVEDDAQTRNLTASLLNLYPGIECVGVFERAETFAEAIAKLRPHVVLMDIGLPGKSGIQAVKELKEKHRDVEFIMFTINEDAEQIVEALAWGATGYLLKNTRPEKIVEAIRDVASGGGNLTTSVTRALIEVLQANRGNRQLLDKLTAREQEILMLLKDGYSRKEICQKLFLAEDTVRSHVRNIYEKFEVHNRAQALKLVFGV